MACSSENDSSESSSYSSSDDDYEYDSDDIGCDIDISDAEDDQEDKENEDREESQERSSSFDTDVVRLTKTGANARTEDWPWQKKILRAEYDKDSSVPHASTHRFDQLSTATGLKRRVIQGWFYQRKKHNYIDEHNWENNKVILLAAYEKDPRMPRRWQPRLHELSETTGLELKQIQSWFKRQPGQKEAAAKKNEENGEESIPDYPKKFRRKTHDQLKMLNAAYANDPSYPVKGKTRMKELSKMTGLRPSDILDWFTGKRSNMQKREEKMKTEEGRKDIMEREMMEIKKKVLRKDFDNDSSTPSKGSDRMTALTAATGLSTRYIGQWFALHRRWIEKQTNPAQLEERRKRRETWERQKKILSESFDGDSTAPRLNTARMADLCAATGLEPHVVQNWFNNRRKKMRDESGQIRRSYKRKTDDTAHIKTEEQIAVLRAAYEENATTPNKYGQKMKKLCAETGLDCNYIQRWFQKQRRRVPTEHALTGKRGYKRKIGILAKTKKNEDSSMNEEASPTIPDNQKKCPVCDSVYQAPGLPIVSMREAKKIDQYFGTALAHFLNYTSAVRICMAHREDCQKAMCCN